MSEPVYIVGVGAVSAIGRNAGENFVSLKSGEAGMGEMKRLQSTHHQLPVAEVQMSNEELAESLGLPAWITRTALLGTLAAKEALQQSGLQPGMNIRNGFISANTVGGMDKTEAFYPAFLRDQTKGRLRNVVHHECGSPTEITANVLGLRDHVATISTACSSSANSIFYAARLIRQQRLDFAIAGGADALTRFTLNGFNTLMILDQQYCQPFDKNRRGLNLGEGAGYVALASEQLMKEKNMTPLAVLSGWCNANDAYHQTASSPDGTGSFLAMKGALEKAKLSPPDIDYINLHGTGTQNNDIAEGTAIKQLFDGQYPSMSSTKSYTGHTLGASGGIEAVYSVLALKHQIVYPSLRIETPMPELPFTVTTKLQEKPIKHVLSNSFGFGGNCSSLIFSAP